MRGSEFNDYNIANPDGINTAKYDEGRIVYKNDTSSFVEEYSTKSVSEEYRVKETFDARKKNNTDIKSNSTQSVSSLSSAAGSISSSIGAFAGVVASTVVAAVIIVAVFISTMTMNLSLVMAGTNSLVIQLDIENAQDEDFEEDIVATISSDDGEYQEQVVTKDSLYLTFNNLKAGKEYYICVKNKDKIFVEKSFFTAKEDINKGDLLARYENNVVVISAANVLLKSNEFYTITAKDASGNVLFTQDSKNPNEEFSFNVNSQTKLYFSLAVNGVAYSVSELEPDSKIDPIDPNNEEDEPVEDIAPEYDYSDGVWTWADDYSKASISFREIHGLDPLVVQAVVSSEKTKYEDCENEGEITYYAYVIETFGNYSDVKKVAIPALKHDYEAEFRWVMSDDPNEVEANVVLVCSRNALHEYRESAVVTYTIDNEASCGEQMQITYTATLVYDGKTYTETKVVTKTIAHEIGSLNSITFPTTIEDKLDVESGLFSGSFKASYICEKCNEEIQGNCSIDKEYLENAIVYTLSYGGASKEYTIAYKSQNDNNEINYKYDENTDSMIIVSAPHSSLSTTRLYVPSRVYGKYVTKVADNAFAETGYEIISLPTTVTAIGENAFKGSTVLTKVIMSSYVTTIGAGAFNNCTALESVELPTKGSSSGLTTIEEGLFAGCTALESLTMPVGKVAWFGRLFGTTSGAGLTAQTDPFTNIVYYIPTTLKSLTLDSSGSESTGGTIGEKEFYGITTIESVTFGIRSSSNPSSVAMYGVATIGQSAFENCINLASVDIAAVRTIGAHAFKNTGVTSIALDQNVTSIGQGFVEGCVNLTSLSVPFIADTKTNAKPTGYVNENTSDTYLLGYFFGTINKTGLTAVSQTSSDGGSSQTYYIPAGLTEIAITGSTSSYNAVGIFYGAFMNCTMLHTVKIGENVSVIMVGAFRGASNLQNVVFTYEYARYLCYKADGSGDGSYSASALADSSANVDRLTNTTAVRWVLS